MLIIFLENVPRDTLIWQQHGHRFFHKYQDWNKEKRWKKGEICQFPLEYVVSKCICSLHGSSKTIDTFFYLEWSLQHVEITLISVFFLSTKCIFFLFFSAIIINHKPCQVWVCLPTCLFGSNMLIVFLLFCAATLLFGQHFHLAVKSNFVVTKNKVHLRNRDSFLDEGE